MSLIPAPPRPAPPRPAPPRPAPPSPDTKPDRPLVETALEGELGGPSYTC